MKTNHTIQRMEASRLAQLRFGSPRRLSPTADGGRWATERVMRAWFLIAWLPVLGCGPAVSVDSLKTEREIVDASGTNKLVLLNVVVGRAMIGSRVDYDFDSLVWKTKVGTNWIERYVISRAAFQGRGPRLRWVSDIDRLESGSGTAVIKVAEESVPTTNGGTTTINVVYSWREWNMITNGEARTLRVCKEPFEKY